jgi:uncharacterized protein (DUF1499 family)
MKLLRIGGVLTTLALTGCSGHSPLNLGVSDGRLAPCPASPNCVSSQATDPQHAIAPLRYPGTAAESQTALKALMQSLPRTRIVRESGGYLYVEFTSALWRFVDDVEFYWDPARPEIQVRSASRLGYGDLGVNRGRVEKIREKLGWEQKPDAPSGSQ